MKRTLGSMVALSAALTLVVTASALASPPAITEFGAGLPAVTSPAAVAAGPDGNVWFTDGGARAVGRITPGGTITEFTTGLRPDSALRVIALGPDGNLWFADASPTVPAIGRITPQGTITEFSAGLNAGSSPDGVVAGPDGNVWFMDRGVMPAVGRITPTGTITEFGGLNPGSSPHGLTVGQDGNLWFVDPGLTRAIGRSTTSGAITEFSTGLNPGSLPDVIVRGPDGNLWFSDQGKTIGAVGRITTSGVITEFGGLSPGGFSRGIAAGPDGNLWFTDQGATKAVGMITTAGAITEFTGGLSPGSVPFRIAAGPDGGVWFSDTGTAKAIGRLDVGAPAASAAIATTGGGGVGSVQTCADVWSDWAGRQPSSAQPLDGYRWLLDGAVVAGAVGMTYVPAPADVGHELSCRSTVTYTLFPTTVSATSLSVLVRDVTAPVLTVPDALVVNATAADGATVTFAVRAVDDVDGSVFVSCTPASGSTFPIGTTTVHCTAADDAGNAAAASFGVRVVGATDQLVALRDSVLGVGPGKSLASKLDVDEGSACASLAGFLAEARAQTAKKIPALLAAGLIADATRIEAVLGC